MADLFFILTDIILPIFILMAIGYYLQLTFKLDLSTLAKLNIYFLVPGFIFVKLYEATFSYSLFLYVLLFFILLVVILFIISVVVRKLLGMKNGEETTFSNSIMFFNSGNYGVPVNDLVFRGDPFAMSIQVIVLMLQNIFLFSYGIFSLRAAAEGKLKAALGYFKMPVLYAMIAGIVLNGLEINIPEFIWVPANYIADAMIGIALITLGAQVQNMKVKVILPSVYISVFLRLIGGPIAALIIIYLFKIDGLIAQAFLIASAMPTSVNSAVIAQEYNNHQDLAAQTVLISTLISSVTVTLVIFVARTLFG
ncbi:AEC family transporter [Saliterribacillus persicus]|uniref:Permease n=1 Tax=Saliterribacillus persicus TaxID=930114 RepID=A0A368Y3X4_9BACI|nr:AEC family transporter [Saliterribacillus persicus]RCW74892.1 hypothetical protein DFR57_103189 [Saliterribacillus persicus]